MPVLENLRAKYAQRDALVLQRVQEYQRDIEEPLTFCEVVEEHDFLSPLYWEDGFVDDVQAYSAYLWYAKPFGDDSAALDSALFDYHMSEQEASFGWAVDDIKDDLARERDKKKKEDSHITA
jgi:hypothetical protein